VPLVFGRSGAAAHMLNAPNPLLRTEGPTAASVLGNERLEGTIEFLKSAAPRLSVLRRDGARGVILELPMPDGAQYQVALVPALPAIAARLLPPLDRRFFWQWPFRGHRYGSPEQAEAEFFRCIGLMLANPTRIVQRRTLVSTQFRCSAVTIDGEVAIGGSVRSLLSVDVPDICGRECTYASPALLAASVSSDGRQDR